MPLTKLFFDRPTLQVAKDLIGKQIVFGDRRGIITETEAYIGTDDPACHAARGKTPRNSIMFGQAGFAYVYFIYGMYYCLNFITEKEGFPAAVLIRGVIDPETGKHYDGPGKLCNYFGITKEHNGINICNSAEFYVDDSAATFKIDRTPRIGIKAGTEKLWRFKAVTKK